MPLQGEAKKLYQRDYMADYMRRRRAGLPTRADAKSVPAKPEPKPKPKCCSFCGEAASERRIMVANDWGLHICESCVAEAAAVVKKRKRADKAKARKK